MRPNIESPAAAGRTGEHGASGDSGAMRPEGRSSPWRRITCGLGVGMGSGIVVIVLALAVIGWALLHNLRAIDHLVERLIEIEEPTTTAAYEMEINVLGSGLGVWKYLGTGAVEHRERVRKDQADFRRFRADYDRLASTPVERELAERLDALYEPYSELCDRLMDTRDEYVALLGRVTETIDEIDRIVDEQIQPPIDVGSVDGWHKLLASTAIEADVAEIVASVSAYAAVPTSHHRDLALAATREAHDRVSAFRELPLTPEERIHGERIQCLLDPTAAWIEQGFSLHEVLRGHESTFIALRGQIDELLDEGIQILAKQDLAGAQPQARSAIDRLHVISLTLLGLGAAVSVGAIGLLAHRSIQLQAANLGLREEMMRRGESESARTRLFSELVSVQEKERGRLARELHDQMGQNLAALKLGLKSLSRAVADVPSATAAFSELELLQAFTGRLIEQVHTIAWELRPAALDDIGVHGVLSNYLDDWMCHSRVKVDFESNLEGQRLPATLEIALYRIVQEALTNVMKHAHAQNVSVTLQRRGHEVVMVVEDDGCGFEADAVSSGPNAKNHLGLLGMKERATLAGGVFEVESAPGAGTTLVVRIQVA